MGLQPMNLMSRVRLHPAQPYAPSRTLRPASRRGRQPKSAGQALVEFALVIPVMLLMLAIAIDFGRLFFSYIEITNAAREGAAFGTHAPSNLTQIQAMAAQETSTQSQGGEHAITVSTTCKDSGGTVLASCALAVGGAAGAGNTITVNVDEPFTFFTPLIGAIVPNLHLTTATTAVVTDYASSSGPVQPGSCSAPVPSFVVRVTSGRTVFADPTGSRPNSGVCNISGYNWSWGWPADPNNDTVGTAIGDSHTYGIDGTYIITLTVSNQAGYMSTTRSVTIPAVAPPVCAKPTADFTWLTSGKTYTYHDASTVADGVNCPITDWLWTFTDLGGTQSNAQNPAAQTYGNNSAHPVTLTVTNAGGSTTITKDS
jgi:Flp pilus assembly protein TadG